MTLVLTGLANGFGVEADDTVDSLGVDAWLVPSGAAGPFLGSSPFPDSVVEDASRIDGVTDAAPAVFAGTTVQQGDAPKNVNVFGAVPEGPGMPAVSDGEVPAAPTDVAVSSTLDKDIGDTL